MTRDWWEAQVLNKVREDGGFSIFWITANQFRAHAANRLEEAGKITRIEIGQFPWCPYRETNENIRKKN